MCSKTQALSTRPRSTDLWSVDSKAFLLCCTSVFLVTDYKKWHSWFLSKWLSTVASTPCQVTNGLSKASVHDTVLGSPFTPNASVLLKRPWFVLRESLPYFKTINKLKHMLYTLPPIFIVCRLLKASQIG